MEWIKAKYDRLLLGICGLIALVVGALVLKDAMAFKSQFPKRSSIEEKENYGAEGPSAIVDAALARLGETVAIVPPVFGGKPASLFSSSPVLKTVDNRVIAVLDPSSDQVRPPLENKWAVDHDLDLRRTDLATVDSDLDGYTNSEEFLGKSNPRDKASVPPFYTKLKLKEILTDEMTLKFSTYQSDTDMSIQRTEPANQKKSVFPKVGESFSVSKDGKPMFKVVKVMEKPVLVEGSGQTVPTPVVFLQDLREAGGTTFEIPMKQSIKLPSYRVKIVSLLGNEELIGSIGSFLTFAGDPDSKCLVKEINPNDKKVILQIASGGKTITHELELQ